MLLPKGIKGVLERSRFYMRFRYSSWMYKFWLWLRADVRKELSLKRSFYKSVLPVDGKMIFDIGANEGTLTEVFAQYAHTVIAVEPSERNVSVLSAKFAGNKNIIIVAKAAGKACGYKDWYEDETDYAMGTLSRKWNDYKQNNDSNTTRIEIVSLDNLIQKFGVPDYVKIDVEGYEHEVLYGLTQPIHLLSFEAILPLFIDETILCINHLGTIKPNASFNYSLDNSLAYPTYQRPSKLLEDIKNIRQTVDVFCKM